MNSSNVVLLLLVVVVSLALVAEATFDLTIPAFALGPVAFGGAALTAAQVPCSISLGFVNVCPRSSDPF